jgi:hypothetical protein
MSTFKATLFPKSKFPIMVIVNPLLAENQFYLSRDAGARESILYPLGLNEAVSAMLSKPRTDGLTDGAGI